jgi:hypothetical protein
MCKWGTHEKVRVKIPKDLSCTGRMKWKMAKIDKCIAPIVKALQEGRIDMRGSCVVAMEKQTELSIFRTEESL